MQGKRSIGWLPLGVVTEDSVLYSHLDKRAFQTNLWQTQNVCYFTSIYPPINTEN